MLPVKPDLTTSIRQSVSWLIGFGLTIVTGWSALNHYYGSFQGGLAWLDASQKAVRELQKQELYHLKHDALNLINGRSISLNTHGMSFILKVDQTDQTRWNVINSRFEPPHLSQASSKTSNVPSDVPAVYDSAVYDSNTRTHFTDEVTRWVNQYHSNLKENEGKSFYFTHQGLIYFAAVARDQNKIALILQPLADEHLTFLKRVTATELILVNPLGQTQETTLSCVRDCQPILQDSQDLKVDSLKENSHVKLVLNSPYQGAYEQYHVGVSEMYVFTSAIPLHNFEGQSVSSLWVVIPEDVMLYWPKRGIIGLIILSILIFTLLIRRLTRLTRERLAPITEMIEEVGQLNQNLIKNEPDKSIADTEDNSSLNEVEKLRKMISILSAQLETNDRLTHQLHQSQKMEVIGTLAGGVAHDFNNLMSVILFNSECLQEALNELQVESTHDDSSGAKELISKQSIVISETERSEWEELVQEMLIACEQAKILTRQLLSISRDQRYQESSFSVYECISEVRSLLRRLVSEEVRLNVQMSQLDLWVMGNENGFKQALMNMMINARDSLESKGSVSLNVIEHYQADHEIVTAGELHQGDYVLFQIQDTGSGIPKENIDHLFSPFFSSKGAKGTGLGLTIVYNTIVKNMGGAIRVTSKLGEGSLFEVLIPRSEPLRESLKPNFTISESQVSAERVVIIEDHDVVRKTLSSTLKSLGFKVTDFASGVEFIQWFEQNSDQVDLVLSDVVMPDMSGPEVWSIVREIRPRLPFLFLTGYTGEAISRYSVPPELILSKPIATHELKEKLLEHLGVSHDS